MPAGPRPTTRPGAGPGRGRSRARPAAPRPPASTPAGPDASAGWHSDDPDSDRSPRSEATPQGAGKQPRSEEATRRRSSLTTRAIALAVVFLILTISYASSLRIYFAQSAEIAATQQEITERQVRIADLQTDLTRWNDPDYVQTQARDRFGWVLPGETGYRVVGEDGQPLGGGEISQATKPSPPKDAWWDKLWGSVQAADQPAPAPNTEPSKAPPITEQTKPR
jgi:cell division protein FtsB